MQSALYGRMKLGNCLKRDYYVGCQADVLTFMDRLCSGRHYCELAIPDNTLQTMVTCPDDLIAYLDATYLCVKVASARDRFCLQGESLHINNVSRGYLASSITESYGIGAANCPWQIQVQKGQRINVTLLDFSLMATRPGGDLCQVYVMIREQKVKADIKVCGGERREKVVYVSEGNVIDVEIMAFSHLQIDASQVQFLVLYEAIGCPSLVPPSKGWVKHDGNRAIIGCNGTGEVRHLVCNGTAWVGDVSSCRDDTRVGVAEFLEGGQGFPVGLLVAIIIGVMLGIILGVVMLTFVMHCLKKRKQRGPQAVRGKIFLTTASVPGNNRYSAATADKEVVQTGDYGYAHVWELQHLRANPDVSDDNKEKMTIMEQPPSSGARPQHTCTTFRQSSLTLAEPKCTAATMHPDVHTYATRRNSQPTHRIVDHRDFFYHDFDPEMDVR